MGRHSISFNISAQDPKLLPSAPIASSTTFLNLEQLHSKASPMSLYESPEVEKAAVQEFKHTEVIAAKQAAGLDTAGVELPVAHREYLLARHGTLDLDPLPSASPADPYNWPRWKVRHNVVPATVQT